MFSSQTNLKTVIGDFHLDRMMRERVLVPRLYNLSWSPGLEAGRVMPAQSHLLVDAQANTQAGFDHACRTDVGEPGYQGPWLVFTSCLNVDIPPRQGWITSPEQVCPLAGGMRPGRKGQPPGAGTDNHNCESGGQGADIPGPVDLEDTILGMGRETKIRISA